MSAEPSMAAVGQQLQARREDLDLTQGEVGQRVGIRGETVSAIERGRNAISRSKRAAWEVVLRLKPGTITRAYKDGTPIEAASGDGEDPLDRLDRLYREWKEDPSRRGRLISMLEKAEADTEEEDPHDRLERLWREYRDDPGEKGTVLRGLLETWGDQAG